MDYDGHQGIAKAKGVDSTFEAGSTLAGHITNGEFSLHKGQLPQMVVGAGLAYKMGMNPAFLASAEASFITGHVLNIDGGAGILGSAQESS